MTTPVHWTKPLQMSISSEKVMRFELVKTISNNCVCLKQLCPTRGPHAAQSEVLCGPV